MDSNVYLREIEIYVFLEEGMLKMSIEIGVKSMWKLFTFGELCEVHFLQSRGSNLLADWPNSHCMLSSNCNFEYHMTMQPPASTAAGC
jgi:hypothetical protein